MQRGRSGGTIRLALAGVVALSGAATSYAAKLVSISPLDRDIILVRVVDGEVTHTDNGLGSTAFTSDHFVNQDTVKRYNPALDTAASQVASNWTISSSQTNAFSGAGLAPSNCYRKSKVNGHAEREWSGSDYQYEYTREHYLYLRLPSSMTTGHSYTITSTAGTNIDTRSSTFTFDPYQVRSEAVHVNLVGYQASGNAKAADVHHWMGSGGARDYSSFVGSTVSLYNVETRTPTAVGTLAFWKASAQDVGWFNLTRSSVWSSDFHAFSTPGTYRLTVDGIGSSQDFVIRDDVYFEPFRTSVKGFFYMRIGQDSTGGIRPVPRRPLYIPGVSPANTTVYITTMHPWHAQWGTFSSGDVWDRPDDWRVFRVSGNPTNPRATGGHSDALDWDRHPGHVAIIYDMLLPFVLTAGAIDNDDLGIAESGNGIPDILDEARNEVDFWLHLREGAGYGSGLTNPNGSNELFQAGATAWAAWASAANAAMLADCFRIAGKTALMNEYRDSAIAAYNHAAGQSNQMLDSKLSCGETYLRGRDLKLLAAVYLYNVTGATTWEQAINQESVCTTPTALLDDFGEGNSRNQVWASAGYLLTPRTVNYPTLQSNMRASMIAEAKRREADYAQSRPSRRACDMQCGYFRNSHYVDRTMIAHAVTANQTEKELFRRALTQEADWGLGRNPLNIIQMTTATTPLASKRSVTDAYTTGRNDGTPGLHPGHTPYMNLDDWACGMTMGCPSQLHGKSYPADFKNTWPIDEGYFPTRYVWAHNEFTPQQTMRGKMALYGYLYGLGTKGSPVVRHPAPGGRSGARGGVSVRVAARRLFVSEPGVYTVRVLDTAGRVVWSHTGRIGDMGLRLAPGASRALRVVQASRSGSSDVLCAVAM